MGIRGGGSHYQGQTKGYGMLHHAASHVTSPLVFCCPLKALEE